MVIGRNSTEKKRAFKCSIKFTMDYLSQIYTFQQTLFGMEVPLY